MAYSPGHTFANDTVLAPADIDTELASIASDSASKDGADLQDATVTNAKLVNSVYEIVLNMSVDADKWQASAAGDVMAVAGLPGDAAAGYTILQIDYLWHDVADVTGTPNFSIDFGYYSAGTWTQTTAVVGTAIALSTTDTTGKATVGTSTVTLSTSNQNFFAIIMDTKGTGAPVFTADVGLLAVSIKLKRTNGLRS